MAVVRAQSEDREPERGRIAVADGAFSYLAWDRGGRERPALLFTHANGFNAETYRTLLSPLADTFRVFAFDMRGHGRTTLPADPARLKEWDTYRDDMIAFLDRLAAERGIDGKLLLAGHSLGASVSLLTAEARPDRAAGLVLVEPVIMPYGYHWWLWLARRLGLRHRASGIAEMAERRRAVFPSREAMIESYRGRGAFATWPEAMLRDYVEGGTRERPDGQVELSCAPAWEAANFRAQAVYLWRRIARIRCPIALLHGTTDSTCPGPVAARIRRLHPGARILGVEGASHFLPMERPDLVRDEIRAAAERVFGTGQIEF